MRRRGDFLDWAFVCRMPDLARPQQKERDEVKPSKVIIRSVLADVAASHVYIWYGMVWYGVVWCGVVWCGVVWYGHWKRLIKDNQAQSFIDLIDKRQPSPIIH